jgi:hypothetical protein
MRPQQRAVFRAFRVSVVKQFLRASVVNQFSAPSASPCELLMTMPAATEPFP